MLDETRLGLAPHMFTPGAAWMWAGMVASLYLVYGGMLAYAVARR